MSIEGSSDTESFGLYPRNIPCPRLKAGQIVIVDNLSVHKSEWVKELIEERGCAAMALAVLFGGLQSYRRSLLQGEGVVEKSESQDPRDALRGYEGGALCGQRRGRSRLLQASWLHSTSGAPNMRTALVVFPRREAQQPVGRRFCNAL